MKRTDIPFLTGLFLAVALLLGTAFTRFYDLAHTPPGEAFDVMWDLSEALRIYRRIPFPLLVGESPETLNRFLLVGWWTLLGPSIFTARLFQACVSLITVALTYRAALDVLHGRAWRRLGALLAAGAMAAITPHLFLSRTPYRAMLAAPFTISALILMLRAARMRRPRQWALAGGVTASSVLTYLAGIAALPWLAGFLLHQKFFRAGQRATWREVGWTLAGALPPLALWGLIIWIVPDYFLRVGEASPEKSLPLLEQLHTGFVDALRAFFTTGYFRLLYNTTDSPFFNPALAVFVIAGLIPALWRWRHAEGALVLGGLLVFLVPGVMSADATMPLRLIGTWGLLSVLAGWGLVWVLGVFTPPPDPLPVNGEGGNSVVGSPLSPSRMGKGGLGDRGSSTHRLSRFPFLRSFSPSPIELERGTGGEVNQAKQHRVRTGRALVTAAVVILIALSLAQTHRTYQGLYNDEDLYDPPEYWLGIPHNYAMALHEALHLMIEADQPTYVPLEVLENPTSGFVLQAKAYPHVTTWARYGLTELPAGQILYPARTLFHDKTAESYPLQALLLPDEGTIVLLPPDGGRPVIEKPQEGEGVEVIRNARGWRIALVQPVPARPLPDRPAPPDYAPVFGDGLRLINWPEAVRLEPGQPLTVILEWEVTQRQKADVFSFAQLIDMDTFGAALSSDHHVWQYIYPSARWRPGDIVPDIHTFVVPEDIQPGWYRWGTGAYVLPRIDRLHTVSPTNMLNPIDDLWLWGALSLDPPQATPLPDDLIPIDVQLGGPGSDDIRLLGYTLDQGADVWTVTLYWQAVRLPQDDYLIFVHAMQGDEFAAQDDGPPNNGQTPTWSWWPGVTVVTRHTLALETSPDAIYVGLYSYPSLVRLPPLRAGEPDSGDGRILIWTN